MEKVNTLDEVMEWFLRNSSGGITCVKGTATCYCETCLEAEEFYEINPTEKYQRKAEDLSGLYE